MDNQKAMDNRVIWTYFILNNSINFIICPILYFVLSSFHPPIFKMNVCRQKRLGSLPLQGTLIVIVFNPEESERHCLVLL